MRQAGFEDDLTPLADCGQCHYLELRNDTDREARITATDRLPEHPVELMAEDPDYLVRVYVARRLPEGRLFRLAVMAKRFGRLCVAVT